MERSLAVAQRWLKKKSISVYDHNKFYMFPQLVTTEMKCQDYYQAKWWIRWLSQCNLIYVGAAGGILSSLMFTCLFALFHPPSWCCLSHTLMETLRSERCGGATRGPSCTHRQCRNTWRPVQSNYLTYLKAASCFCCNNPSRMFLCQKKSLVCVLSWLECKSILILCACRGWVYIHKELVSLNM